MTYQESLTALSDPTRRGIFEAVAARPSSVGALAERFPVSRPAVSQHLRVLTDAGLVAVTSHGTRRIYRANPEALRDLRSYLDRLWGDVLTAFAAEIEKENRND